MTVPDEAVLLRIFIGSADRHGLTALSTALVNAARTNGLAGATVLRGTLGFGHARRMREGRFLPFSDDHPVIVEIVDSPERIEAFLPVVDGMMQSGLVTIERARVLHYGHRKPGLIERFRRHVLGETPQPGQKDAGGSSGP